MAMICSRLKCLTYTAFFVVIPVRLYADAEGPPPGFAGVPGEFGTCATCHVGGSGSGSVKVTFPNGLTYVPGVSQNLVVTVADPSQQRWGFELTARQSASTGTQAGTFSPGADGFTQTVCATPVTIDQTACSSSMLEYIEQTLVGTRNGTTGSVTFQFTWTPPSTNKGNVTVYVAANAANGDDSPSGDHIYTAEYTLKPAASSPAPAILQAGGVLNGASFQPGLVAGSWVTIYGTNISSQTDSWINSIVKGVLPTTLDNVSVSIGGQPAYISYINSTQVNAIVPKLAPGQAAVTVTNANGTSPTVMAEVQALQPAFFQWGNYAVATSLDYTFLVKNGVLGAPTTPAKPGEVVVLWGTGFGPTSPSAPEGVEVAASPVYNTASTVKVTVGGKEATVYGAALASGFAGLYQVSILIPASLTDGDYPVIATISGAKSPATTLITVQK